MNVKTRSMSKKQEMTASSDSKKLDDLLTKMDKNTQLFVSDDVSRAVRKERAKLRKDYLPAV